jgi:hypothetical protein
MNPSTATPGKLGAKHQSFDKGQPRARLLALMLKYPDDPDSMIVSRFQEAILLSLGLTDPAEDYAELLTMLAYWAYNNMRSIRDEWRSGRRATTREEMDAETAKVREVILARLPQVALLETVLPNGKKLRDTTGVECLALAGDIGPWLRRIAERVGRNQKVGSVLSEVQVKEMYLQL